MSTKSGREGAVNHVTETDYPQLMWWYRAAFWNERAILKYLKGCFVSENLSLLCEVLMD